MIIRFITIFSLLLLYSCAKQHKEVVAEVNGIEILADELSQQTKQEIFDLLNLAYDIKDKALNDLVRQKILIAEANKRKMTLDEYLNDYIHLRLKTDTTNLPSQNLNTIYKKNTSRNVWIQQLADSLYHKAHVRKYIYPPKQPHCAINDLCVHYRGNLESAVTFIVVSDYTCDRCIEFEKTLKRIFDNYHDKVKFGYVNYAAEPTLSALACEAAGNQYKFWEFHEAIFNYKGMVDSTFIFNFAKTTHLNLQQFKQDLISKKNYDRINSSIDELAKRGLFATPTIIINDRLVYKTNSYEELTKLLDNELQTQ